jgi:hypothetical protein
LSINNNENKCAEQLVLRDETIARSHALRPDERRYELPFGHRPGKPARLAILVKGWWIQLNPDGAVREEILHRICPLANCRRGHSRKHNSPSGNQPRALGACFSIEFNYAYASGRTYSTTGMPYQ